MLIFLSFKISSNLKRYSPFSTGTETKTANTIGNVYAVGGPTIELLYASVKEKYLDGINGTLSPTVVGYNIPLHHLSTAPYKAKYNETKYGMWWLASPNDYSFVNMCEVGYTGSMTNGESVWRSIYNEKGITWGVRPLISIPLDSFDVDNWIVQPTTNP